MKKRNIAALAGVAAIFAVGGSLAYFNQTMEVENNFDTAKYGSTLVEDFNPSDGHDWEPGVEINKDVLVTNTGDKPVVVRVRFDETWKRGDEAFVDIKAEDDTRDGKENKIMNVFQTDPADGVATADVDDSVVEKKLANTEDWIYQDGYYYYRTALGSKLSTSEVLDAVKLTEEADMGQFLKKKYYSLAETAGENDWIPFPEKDGKDITEAELAASLPEGEVIRHIKSDVAADAKALGYADADYTLKITAEVIQATSEAVDAVFGKGTAFEAPNGCDWELK
ncbi:BsaA family SipW-dependent biofilm matrix protein [uncultured Clostridium sp.]|uniref:BsaA family SipW-dependent biofilm matrix protein n=1 Tax=uncultured Clostridium sp. TaxID=59620 RepID=UPI0025D75223|nr:BsaA family SipW-dependent biofilm matrix protein [uncultured Clostridium sp.]